MDSTYVFLKSSMYPNSYWVQETHGIPHICPFKKFSFPKCGSKEVVTATYIIPIYNADSFPKRGTYGVYGGAYLIPI